mmetsp:Transcript_19647/g.45719  ORF Transcript_19647/g.45719 Transcript_19647/m.45719 type:complete len:223 (+) Transcript_19647:275-943(+)
MPLLLNARSEKWQVVPNQMFLLNRHPKISDAHTTHKPDLYVCVAHSQALHRKIEAPENCTGGIFSANGKKPTSTPVYIQSHPRHPMDPRQHESTNPWESPTLKAPFFFSPFLSLWLPLGTLPSKQKSFPYPLISPLSESFPSSPKWLSVLKTVRKKEDSCCSTALRPSKNLRESLHPHHAPLFFDGLCSAPPSSFNRHPFLTYTLQSILHFSRRFGLGFIRP